MAWRKYKLLVCVEEGDELELPLFVTDSVKEMAELTGVTLGMVYYSIRKGRFVESAEGFVRVIDCTEGE
jgi:hypothetical protein